MIDKRAEVRNPQLLRMAPVEAVQHKAARIGMGWWQFQQLGQYPHVLARVNSAEECGVASTWRPHWPIRQLKPILAPLITLQRRDGLRP